MFFLFLFIGLAKDILFYMVGRETECGMVGRRPSIKNVSSTGGDAGQKQENTASFLLQTKTSFLLLTKTSFLLLTKTRYRFENTNSPFGTTSKAFGTFAEGVGATSAVRRPYQTSTQKTEKSPPEIRRKLDY